MLDASGLQEKGLKRAGYQVIHKRVRVIRPEESIVGVILCNDTAPAVVKSQASGIMQHALTTWQFNAETGQLVLAEQPADLSRNLERTFKQWMNELSSQELRILFDTLSDILMSSGIKSINDVTIDRELGAKLATSIASLYSIGMEKKLLLTKSAKLFLEVFVGYSKLGSLGKDRIALNFPDSNSLLSYLNTKKLK